MELRSAFSRCKRLEGQAGLAFLFRGVRLTYTQVLRTPEFFERDRWDQFGSVNVTFRY